MKSEIKMYNMKCNNYYIKQHVVISSVMRLLKSNHIFNSSQASECVLNQV